MTLRRIVLGLSVVALVNHTTSAFAQTAEETVSFIVQGLEDGKVIQKDNVSVASVSETAKSPANYLISPPGTLDFDQLTVTQIERCKFQVVKRKGDKIRYSTYDFNNLTDVSFTLGYGLLNFSGQCPIKDDDGSCNATDLISNKVPTPPRRIIKAISFMKSTYCGGSAF